MRGVLFKNKRKKEGSKQPDYTGSCQIDGVELWISAWLNTSRAGEKYYSFNFQKKEDTPGHGQGQRGGGGEEEDDIPF